MKEKGLGGFLYRILCGFFLGVSIIAPGVSGSVIAVMMGIYHDLIGIVANPFKRFKHNFFYLLPMGIGAVLSALIFVKFFGFLFDDYETQARMLFMGLVCGGLPTMLKQARQARWCGHYLIGVLLAFATAATVGMLVRFDIVAVSQSPSLWYLCIAGVVAGACSMMPGMSVSMVLMLFGAYTYLMSAASNYTSDIMGTAYTIIPVALCFVLGMVLFSKVTKLILSKYSGLAYFMIFGFMCGTLTAVFPKTAPASAMGWVGGGLMLIAGLGISLLFILLGRRMNSEEDGGISAGDVAEGTNAAVAVQE